MVSCGLPTRYQVALLIFSAAVINNVMRTNISMSLIAMVIPIVSNSSSMNSACVADNTANFSRFLSNEYRAKESITFAWTEQQQAYILSSYFYGNAVTSLIGGTIAERFGPRRVIFICMCIYALTTLLCPYASRISYLALIAVRMVSGFASGCLFPTFHVLVARWAPPAEKGRFISSQVGGSLGTVLTWNLLGPIIETFGWEYSFYVPGGVSLIWCFIWLYFVYDSPAIHPRISEAEKQYIIDAIGDRVKQTQNTKVKPPYKSILTSTPVLAMVLLQFGNLWGIYFMITAGPKYVSSALGFNLSFTGTLASLPNLAKLIMSWGFGYIGDRLIKNKTVYLKFLRKFFCLFSHFFPGLLLLGLGYTGCSPYYSLSLIILSTALNGAAVHTSMVNAHDLAPNFVGTLSSIASAVGTTAGFISPLVTAYYLKDGNGFEQWRPVFTVGASIFIFTAVLFVIFGSTETMHWNYIADEEQKVEGKNMKDNNKSIVVSDPEKQKF